MGLTAFCVLVHEIVAEIAAPHQNEGPHLAAGQPARISADRSGARGKRRPAGNYLCGEATNRIPNRRGSRMGPLPFPLLRFWAGRGPLSRLPFGAPKPGAVLTAAP